MEIIFSKNKLEINCTNIAKAKKEYGEVIGKSLLARIQLLKAAKTIKDIVAMPTLNFHGLKGKDKGKFAIDVKTRREPWRLILEPLDANNERFNPCNIDEIANKVEKVLIVEVSKHYE